MNFFIKGLAVAAISVSLFACNNKKAGTASSTTSEKPAGTDLRIAYVNIDTLQNNLEFFKAKKAEFEKKEANARGELANLEKQLQNEYVAFQKAAQAGTLTQADGEAKQKRLGQLQQNLQTKQAALESQFAKEMDAFNTELKKRLDDFLADYNKDKKYDYILSHGMGSQILFAKPEYDITKDVIAGMNKAGISSEAIPAAADTAK